MLVVKIMSLFLAAYIFQHVFRLLPRHNAGNATSFLILLLQVSTRFHFEEPAMKTLQSGRMVIL